MKNYKIIYKELNEIILGKGFFAPIKEHLCMTNRHLGNQEGQVEVEYPLTESCF